MIEGAFGCLTDATKPWSFSGFEGMEFQAAAIVAGGEEGLAQWQSAADKIKKQFV